MFDFRLISGSQLDMLEQDIRNLKNKVKYLQEQLDPEVLNLLTEGRNCGLHIEHTDVNKFFIILKGIGTAGNWHMQHTKQELKIKVLEAKLAAYDQQEAK